MMREDWWRESCFMCFGGANSLCTYTGVAQESHFVSVDNTFVWVVEPVAAVVESWWDLDRWLRIS